MTTAADLPPRRRKGLRRRLVLSLLGLALIPIVAALSALFFVVRNDVGEIQGNLLAREAGQLAEHLRAESYRAGQDAPPVDMAELARLLERKHRELSLKEEAGALVLFSAEGRRLAVAGRAPVPPMPEGDRGWVSFGSGDDGYFAGVQPVLIPGTPPGSLFLAVVQPSSTVFEHLYSVTLQTGLFLALFLMVVATMAWRLADQYMRPIAEIRRGAEIVSRINLDHRIKIDTGDEIEELAVEFNLMAEKLGRVYHELEERVRDTTRTVQEERNRLATVLRTMVDGVVVANEAGEVILMNPGARMILDRGYSSGIGAPLTDILPSDRLGFHLRRLRKAWAPGREAVEEVVLPLSGGKLLKGSLSVIPGPDAERAGFLLVFRDLSAPATDGYEEPLRAMPRLLRGPVATSRALVETLQRHRDMSAEKRQAFIAALEQEQVRLSEQILSLEEAAAGARTSRWPAITSHPGELLEEALETASGQAVSVETVGTVPMVQVEPFSWVASLRCILDWIERRNAGRFPVVASLSEEEGSVVTSLRVLGPLRGNAAELESLPVSPAGEEPLSLGETVRRNRGELWIRSQDSFLEVRLALLQSQALLPRSGNGLIEGEPEFYDFDLFLPRPVPEREEQLRADLAELEYVVFDTETTGLQISQGDKVVSISAVRIRRGRVQNADVFHTLVNPGRHIPAESTAFHHIEDHMVADAPSMNEVYPQFVKYAGDAVLVAHNAAFDKKCLDMAAAEAGLPQVDNPILDTLFLSVGLHSGTEGHSLEAMAERMGITIEGRHTSLGDARATAQIFLGLMSLLPARGVRTLAEAKAFCDANLLLRWQSSRF